MHPKEKIQQDLIAAMKSGDADRRRVLRLLMSLFKQVEVDQRTELSESDAWGILMTEAKQRREALAEQEKAGREDLAKEERYVLSVIEEYLPQQLSREEIETRAREAIAEVGATSPRDMRQVMKVIMPRVKGQADGKLVNEVVRDLLS